MHIPVRFGLLFLIFLLMMGAGYFYQWNKQTSQQLEIKQMQSKEFLKTFRTIVSLKSSKTKTYAYDYSYWDEMVTFLSERNAEWAQINIASSLESMETDYAAVIGKNGALIYEAGSVDPRLDKAVTSYPYDSATPRFASFFVATDAGPYEIYIAPIQNSDDIKRLGIPYGYFVTAKLWNDAFVGDLATITGQHVAYVAEDSNASYDIIYPLQGSDGKALYKLGITLTTPTLDALERFFRENLSLLFIFFVFWATIFGWMVYRYIIRPLGSISAAMKNGDDASLQPLLGRRDEMGEIARLVREFSVQHQKLQEQIEKGIFQDQMLIQQNRRAAMGEMIGNIAHQWRQPLNALGLLIQNLEHAHETQSLDDTYLRRSVEKSNRLIRTMSSTIDDFRNFFKPDKQTEVFALADAYGSAIAIVGPSLQYHDIRLEERINVSVCVHGFPNEFAQVLLNVIDNAKDALVEHRSEERVIRVGITADGDQAVITIEDNAGGIPAHVLEKIFDPYFTTKEEGKGTGIGLYMSKTIVETSMHGTLEAANGADGAKFTVRFRAHPCL